MLDAVYGVFDERINTYDVYTMLSLLEPSTDEGPY